MSSRTLLRAGLRAGLRAVLGAAALALASPVLADYPERPLTLVAASAGNEKESGKRD